MGEEMSAYGQLHRQLERLLEQAKKDPKMTSEEIKKEMLRILNDAEMKVINRTEPFIEVVRKQREKIEPKTPTETLTKGPRNT